MFSYSLLRSSLCALPILSALNTCALFRDEETVGRPCWVSSHQGSGEVRPVVVGSTVVTADGSGALRGVDKSTGGERWRSVVSSVVSGTNLIARQRIVVAAVSRAVVGVDDRTGMERWRFLPPIDSLVSPIGPGSTVWIRMDADDSTVYVPAMGGSVSALDVVTGVPRWQWHVGGSGLRRTGANGVRFHKGTLYVTVWRFLDASGISSEPSLVALDAGTGVELWRQALPLGGGVAVQGAPAVFENVVALSLPGGDVYALDRVSGQQIWRIPSRATAATVSQVEIMDGVVYFDGGDANVYGADALTGVIRWVAAYGAQSLRDMLVTERRLYVHAQANLVVLNRSTGKRIAIMADPTATGGDRYFASPAAASQGRVYINGSSGVACFREP